MYLLSADRHLVCQTEIRGQQRLTGGVVCMDTKPSKIGLRTLSIHIRPGDCIAKVQERSYMAKALRFFYVDMFSLAFAGVSAKG